MTDWIEDMILGFFSMFEYEDMIDMIEDMIEYVLGHDCVLIHDFRIQFEYSMF